LNQSFQDILCSEKPEIKKRVISNSFPLLKYECL
jgi:hypothetical protein